MTDQLLVRGDFVVFYSKQKTRRTFRKSFTFKIRLYKKTRVSMGICRIDQFYQILENILKLSIVQSGKRSIINRFLNFCIKFLNISDWLVF